MKKTIISVNNIDLSGRLPEDAIITGKRASFRILHNFGGDKGPISLFFAMFPKRGQEKISDEDLALLKKGTKIIVHAYEKSNQYTNEAGETKFNTEYIVKSIEPADKETSVNNIDFTGRLWKEPEIGNKRCVLNLIHDISKEVMPIFKDIILFDKTGKKKFNIPEELLKKGTAVLAHAYFTPNNWVDEDGNIIKYNIECIGKNVEPAEMTDGISKSAKKEVEDMANDTSAEEVDEAIDIDIDGISEGINL